jgi:hypothetical protein
MEYSRRNLLTSDEMKALALIAKRNQREVAAQTKQVRKG